MVEKTNSENKCLFSDNIGLFLTNYDEIISNPKFSNIEFPYMLWGSAYVLMPGGKITLGELLKIYKNEEDYSNTCPECKGKVYLTYFGFSPLSGITSATHKCVNSCKQVFHKIKSISGNKLRSIRLKYQVENPDVEPIEFVKLLAHLVMKREVKDENISC